MRLAPLLLLVTAAACGDNLSVGNASPRGSVGGLIVDASSRAPIEGATITLVAGGDVFDPEVSAADGSFRFAGVPFGTVLLLITPPEGAAYADATVHGMLAGEAGDFPVDNESLTIGPIGLVPTAATPFRFRVLDNDGAPVTAYDVAAQTTVEWIDYSGGPGVAMGERIITAVTDNDGYATIPGLPEYWRLSPTINDGLVVNLPPLDAGGDGIYEYPGGFTVFNLLALGNPTPDVILDPGYTTSLAVQASSIDSLTGGGGPSVLGMTNDAWIKFNLPITDDVTVTVGNELGQPVGSPAVEVVGDTVRLGFAGLGPGAEYNVTVHVIAAVGDHAIDGNFSGAFFTPPVSDVTIVGGSRDPSNPNIVHLTFSEPIGLGFAATLNGGNCILFFNADLGGTTLPIGDVAGEIGNAACESWRALWSEEPDPQGPVGYSGFTTRWAMDVSHPLGGQLGTGTQAYLTFSHVLDPSYRLRRVDGTFVPDIMAFSLP